MIAQATASLLVKATGAPTARSATPTSASTAPNTGSTRTSRTSTRSWRGACSPAPSTSTKPAIRARRDPGPRERVRGGRGLVDPHLRSRGAATANAGGEAGWFERMEPVADRLELARAFAAEHYFGHWDGYSVAAGPSQPNNYYLHSDLAGRFSLIVSGTDQTWLERSPFGVYGTGVLMRGVCHGCHLGSSTSMCCATSLPARLRRAPGAGARDSRRDRPLARARSPARADSRRGRGAGRCQDRDHGRPPAGAGRMACEPVVRRCRAAFRAVADDVPSTRLPPPAPAPPSPRHRRPWRRGTGSATPYTGSHRRPLRPKPLTLPPVVWPVLGKAVGLPAKPIAGKRFTFLLPVTPSDTGARLLTGHLDCSPSVAGKAIRHTASFKAGKETLGHRPEGREGQAAEGQGQDHGIGPHRQPHLHLQGSLTGDDSAARGETHEAR